MKNIDKDFLPGIYRSKYDPDLLVLFFFRFYKCVGCGIIIKFSKDPYYIGILANFDIDDFEKIL